MKKSFIAVLTIALAISLCNCAPQDRYKSIVAGKPRYNEKTNQRVSMYGISFQVPKAWRKVSTDEETVQYLDYEKDIKKASVYLRINLEEDTALSAIKAEDFAVRDRRTQITKLSETNLVIANMPAKKIEINHKTDGKQYERKIYLLKTSAGLMSIGFVAWNRAAYADFDKVLASIKTFQTNKQHKIATDAHKPLPYSKADNFGVFASKMATVGRSSTYRGFLDEFSEISYVEMRDIGDTPMPDGDSMRHMYYCVFKEKNSKVFVFLGEDLSDNPELHIRGIYSKNRSLTFQDFDALKIGVSTSQDVAKIDPTAHSSTSYFYMEENNLLHGLGETTYHMTKEGYVEITYQKKGKALVVDKIAKKVNAMIQKINPVDR